MEAVSALADDVEGRLGVEAGGAAAVDLGAGAATGRSTRGVTTALRGANSV